MIHRQSLLDLGIRSRILMLALAPTLVMALLMVDDRLDSSPSEVRLILEQQGQSVAEQLAISASRALPKRELERLRVLCGSALRHPEVIRAAVLGADLEPVVECGSAASAADPSRLFRVAIQTQGRMSLDAAGRVTSHGSLEPLGWVEIQLSLRQILARERETMLIRLAIVVGGLLLGLIAARTIGSGISEPLLALRQALLRPGASQTVRIDPGTPSEIRDLVQGFKRLAESIEEAQGSFRVQVSETTQELQRTVAVLSERNAQLEAAREQAVTTGREKQDLLARMSHEIRTPLNAVIGFSRLLQRQPDRRELLEYTRTIDRAASQLLCVIDGILSVSKLEAGRFKLESRPFNLRDCLEDVVAMMTPAAHEKGLELALVVHRDVDEILIGDPDRVAQVMLNLLNNAVKFTAQGHVFVEAGYLLMERGRHRLSISVSDTGIGLSEEARALLFQPYGQADSSITRHYGGTGLGLVISKGLVELMGGEIEVESELGQGSRFVVSIPFEPVSEASAEACATPLAGRKILIYDRQAIQLRALRAILLDWSAEVFGTGQDYRIPLMLRGAADGGRPFDLLILGLDRTESSGHYLKKLATRVRLCFGGPVLVLVGTEDWHLPPGLEHRGDWEWTLKPARRSLLLDRLSRLMGSEPPRELTSESLSAPQGYAGRHVLVVEDNLFNRLLMHHLLELRGLSVSEAHDGIAALGMARQVRFDLIFLDIHMPGMDGIETARRIRTIYGEEGCPPIIALTADVFVQERVPDEVRIFQELMPKPIAEPALDEILRRSLMPNPDERIGDPCGASQPPGSSASPPLTEALRSELRLSLGQLRGRLASALAAGQRRAIAEIAHELKGLCGFYALSSFEPLIEQLERLPSEPSTADPQGLLDGFDELIRHA